MNITPLTRDCTDNPRLELLVSNVFRKFVHLYLASVESAVDPVVLGIEAPKGERKRGSLPLQSHSADISVTLGNKGDGSKNARKKGRKREREREREWAHERERR